MQRAGEQMDGMRSVRLVSRLAAAVPRYTSYPTAPHFHEDVSGEVLAGWLSRIGSGEDISLYLHIPFCDRLCWFCACHTRMTRRYEPVAAFLDVLMDEIAMAGDLIGGRGRVRAIHFGGGSPTILQPHDILRLGKALDDAFDIRPDADICVELDPNDMDEARLDAFAQMGMTRASLGVQDFDARVQKAINREQSFEQTRWIVDGVRERGVKSVNLDLLYGLPHQNEASIANTIAKALTLSPDRIALFGYAHVPWFKKHQTMIDEAALPDAQERLAQQNLAAAMVRDAGYQAIGIDHFAKPDDALAVAARHGRLRRNFQGYTEDACETLLGLGPSSVSRLREGYAQNATATGQYERLIRQGRLATARGVELNEDDHARAWVIERLMCDFGFSAREAIKRFDAVGWQIVDEALACTREHDAMLVREGDHFLVVDEARPLVRSVAARFDSYLHQGAARHSTVV